MLFSKNEWFIPHHSGHKKKSSVGNLLSWKSPQTSTVNSRSSFIEFIATKQILAILLSEVSFRSKSSFLAASFMINLFSFLS